jgi:hypothetical protein
MVMANHGTENSHRLNIIVGRESRCGHTGQDSRVGEEVVHGRAQHHMFFQRTQRHSVHTIEVGALDIVSIDERLLTGDLEEDISILSIVA